MEIRLSLALPADAASVPLTRRVVTDALTVMGVDDECVAEVGVAISEACTNVLDHAGGTEYDVVATIDEQAAVIQVLDRGAGFEGAVLGGEDAPTDAETGRGIQLMRRLVDRVRFEVALRGGTVLHLEKRLTWRPDALGRPPPSPPPRPPSSA